MLGGLRDLTVEAGTLARRDGASATSRAHVASARAGCEPRLSPTPLAGRFDAGRHRYHRYRAGAVLGQANGPRRVLNGQSDGFAFGKPARITARTSPGMAGIVNIERETMMSGAAHSKGILVLGGFLAGRFAADFPLSLAASICFEQIYGEIEGDSASSAGALRAALQSCRFCRSSNRSP